MVWRRYTGFLRMSLLTCFALLVSCQKTRNPEDPKAKIDPSLPSFVGIQEIVNVESKSLRIIWSPISGVAEYSIERIVANEKIELARAQHPQDAYTLSSLQPETSYTFQVRAIYTDSRLDKNEKKITVNTLPLSQVEKEFEIDFSRLDGFVFPQKRMEWINQSFQLSKFNRNLHEDMFDDGNTSNWNPISYSGSFVSSRSENNNIFSIESMGTLIGMAETSFPSLRSSTTTISVTPRSFQSLALLGVMARNSGNAFYMGATYSGSHRIMYYNGSSFSLVAQTKSLFEPQVGQKYHMKFQTAGVNLRYKIWIDGSPEPDWILSTKNTFLKKGNSGILATGGRQDYEWFEVLDEDSASEEDAYSKLGEALKLTEWQYSDEAAFSKITAIVAKQEVPEGSSILYEVSTDSGGTWQVPNEGVWNINKNAASGSVAIEAINEALPALDMRNKKIQLRAYLKSEKGEFTPVLFGVKIKYEILE